MPPSWLPLVVCIIGLASMVARSLHMRRQEVNPWVLPVDDSAEGFLGRCFFALVALSFVALIVQATSPVSIQKLVGTFPALEQALVAWTGVALMVAGTSLILLAQRQMGRAWRVGIPQNERPRLVTSGVFGHSRNPIFLGILFVGIGIALAVPNALTWALFVATYLALSVQIRLEEAYLQASLGGNYGEYKARVGRWLGTSKQVGGAAWPDRTRATTPIESTFKPTVNR